MRSLDKFHRKVRVVFSGQGDLIVNPGIETDEQLLVEFDIEKSISGTSNELNINIYNLAETSRNAIGKEFSDIEIQAGYVPPDGNGRFIDLTGVIFSGQIEDWTHNREGPDIITTVRASDGGKAIRKSTIAQTFPAGTPVELIVEALFAKFAENGVLRGEWIFPEMEPYLRPYSISGAVSRELNQLGRSHGFYWSIQNQVMEIIPGNFYLPLITELNKNTGMIGYPQVTDNGVRVISLINPEIRPNRLIAIQSEFVEAANGEFRVGSIGYRGDNRDGNFYMQIHAERAQGGAVDEGVK